jgi:hypothetical protein
MANLTIATGSSTTKEDQRAIRRVKNTGISREPCVTAMISMGERLAR